MPRGVYARASVEERFRAQVDENGPVPVHAPELGPCHLWTGATAAGGYGLCYVYVDGKRVHTSAHRAAWLLSGEAIPAGVDVLHRCDNPPCVRKSHLRPGTPQDNMDDMLAKGRCALGADSLNAKLTDEAVREIRSLYAAGGTSHKRLAKKYGVSRPTIKRVLKRETWKHL